MLPRVPAAADAQALPATQEEPPMTPAAADLPRRVLLFSGHMIDAPGRPVPRFPPASEPAAAQAVGRTLDALGAGAADLAICGGACGGDLLFAEAALARGARLELYLPLPEDDFLAASVDFAGGDWHARYLAARAAARLHPAPPAGPDAGDDPYERNNRRMLDAACRFGAERLDFVCLWDGRAGDGRGGTAHLIDEVGRRSGRVHRIDAARLRG